MEFISPSASRLVEGSAAERCRLDLRYATDAEEDAPDIAALVSNSRRYNLIIDAVAEA